jgi:hypothetical protein
MDEPGSDISGQASGGLHLEPLILLADLRAIYIRFP